MAVKIIRLICYVGLWLTTGAVAFYFGTYYPNQKTILKIQNEAAVQMQKNIARHPVYEPEMIYNDNVSFMKSVHSCIDYVNLKITPDQRIHKDIIIAMAVVESGYGKSRFAIKGNNLFVIRTWDKNVAKLKQKENPSEEWGVKIYITKCKSVADMISILNRLDVYEEFRTERRRQLLLGILDIDKLINHLHPWSTNPNYVDLIKQKAKKSAKIFSDN